MGRATLILLAFIGCLSAAAFAVAQDRPVSDSADGLRRLHVPADAPDAWPPGKWQVVAADEFARLLAQTAKQPPHPPQAFLSRVEYTAVLTGNRLEGTSITATVAMNSTEDVLLPLGPTNLAVSELRWSDGPATWGTTADDRSLLVVPGSRDGTRTLRGEWSLVGTAVAQGVDFDLQLLPAATSSLWLELPNGYEPLLPDAQAATVSADATKPGRWRIDVGHEAQVRLKLLIRRSGPTPEVSSIVAKRESSWSLQRTQAQLQTRFDLEISDRPADALTFLVPKEVRVYSITYGGESVLSWRMATASDAKTKDSRQRIVVELPDPLLGQSRPLRLVGVVTATLGEPWTLPEIELRSASLISSRTTIAVAGTLELRQLKNSGHRQTAVANGSDGTTTLAFEQYQPRASLRLTLREPQPVLAVESFSWLDTRPGHWRLWSEQSWTAVTGTAYEVACQLPEAWEVTEVRCSDIDAVAQWTVTTDAGERTLRVELRTALTAEKPLALQVRCRHLPNTLQASLPLPVLRPRNCQTLTQIVAVTSAAGRSWVREEVDDSSPWLSADALPEFVFRSAPGVALLAEDEDSATYFRFRSPDEQFDAILDPSIPWFDADVAVEAKTTLDELQQKVTIGVTPLGVPVENLVITTGPNDPDMHWHVLPEDPELGPLTVRAVNEQRNANSQPAMRLHVSPPSSKPFRLVGQSTRPLADEQQVLSPFLPEARRFKGRITIENEGFEPGVWQSVTVGSMQSTTRDTTGHDSSPSFNWSYTSGPAALMLRRSPVAMSTTAPVATVELRSVLNPDSSGQDYHEATFRVAESRASLPSVFRLPPATRLLRVEVDDHPTAAVSTTDGFQLPATAGRDWREVVVTYVTPARTGWLETDVEIPLPQTDLNILEAQWNLAVAPKWRLAAASAPLRIESALARPTWTERLFGPLGRPASETVFAPFSQAAWLNLVQEPATEHTTPQLTDPADFWPANWPVYQFISPEGQPSFVITLWQPAASQTLGWAVLLSSLLLVGILRVTERAWANSLIAALISLCLAAGVVAPLPWVMSCGGACAGLLIGQLLPDRFFRRSAQLRVFDSDSVSIGSTATVHKAGAVFLVVIALTSAISADETPPAGETPKIDVTAADIVPSEWDVLVPLDTDTEDASTPEVVYVRRAVLQELRGKLPATLLLPSYLLSRAKYEVTVGNDTSILMTAQFQVVPLTDGLTTVQLPIGGAHLAVREGCTVDGRPVVPLPAADGIGCLVELPPRDTDQPAIAEKPTAATGDDSQTYPPRTVRLKLHLKKSSEVEGESFRVDLPRVLTSQMSIHATELLHQLTVGTSSGTTVATEPVRTATVALGPTGTVEVRWQRTAVPEPAAEPFDVAARFLVTVQPLHRQVRARLAYHVEGRGLQSVALSVPPEASLGRVFADGTFRHSVAPYGSRRQLLVEFDRPRTGDFVVDVTYLVPYSRRTSQVVIAPADLLHVPQDALAPRMSTVSIGIATTAEYELSQAGPAVTEGIVSQLPERFLSDFRGANLRDELRTPQFAYHLVKPQPLRFAITPKPPVLQVRMTHEGVVREQKLQWTTFADLEVSGAPNYAYELEVPARLRIESASVVEDETERLARWTRTGNRLMLLLSSGTTGRQTIRIHGDMPLQAGRSTALPDVRLVNAEPTNARVRLFHVPSVRVELDHATLAWPSGTKPSLQPANTELVPLAVFDLPRDEQPLLTVKPATADLDATAVLVLGYDAAERGSVRCLWSIKNTSQSLQPVALRVPAGFTDYRVQTSDGENVAFTAEEAENGSHLLRLTDLLVGGSSRWLEFSATIAVGPGGRVACPWPEIVDSQTLRYVVLANGITLAAQGRPTTIEPATLPEWASQFSDMPQTVEIFRGYSANTIRARIPATTDVPMARGFIESEVRLTGTGQQFGQTVICLTAAWPRPLVFDWPAEAKLRALLVNGEPMAALVEGRRLRVPALTGSGPHLVLVSWSVAQPASSIEELQLSVPQLRESSFGPQSVTVLPSRGIRLIGNESAIDSRTPVELLEEAESLLEIVRWYPPDSKTLGSRVVWVALRRSWSRLQSAAETSQLPTNVNERLASVTQEIETSGFADVEMAPEPAPESFEALSPQRAWTYRTSELQAGTRTWHLDRGLARWVIGGLVFFAVWAAMAVLMRGADWLQERPAVAVGLLAGLWWACFTASEVGLLLVVVALGLAWRSWKSADVLEVPTAAVE